MLKKSIGAVRNFYHFHGKNNALIRVPAPEEASRLKYMDYSINNLMEMRSISAQERITHFKLRKERARIMRSAGHAVDEVAFPNPTLARMISWTELNSDVKKELVKTLVHTGFVQRDVFPTEGLVDMLLGDAESVASIRENPILAPFADQIFKILKALAAGLPDWMFFANTLVKSI